MTATKPIIYTGSGSAIDNYNSAKPIGTPKSQNFGKFNKNDPQHRLILSLLHQVGWTTIAKNKPVPDIERFSLFLESDKSPVKKPLLRMDHAETEKIITALSGMVNKKYK